MFPESLQLILVWLLLTNRRKLLGPLFLFRAFLLICITFHDTVRKSDIRALNMKSLGNLMCVHVYVARACVHSCSYKYGQIHMKYACRHICVCTCVEILMQRCSSTLFYFFFFFLLKGGFLLKSKLADLTFPKRLPVSTFRMFWDFWHPRGPTHDDQDTESDPYMVNSLWT